MHSFGCHFVEVTWQPEIARLRVSPVVSAMDAGRIINPLAGRNQIQGAVVMGIGMGSRCGMADGYCPPESRSQACRSFGATSTRPIYVAAAGDGLVHAVFPIRRNRGGVAAARQLGAVPGNAPRQW